MLKYFRPQEDITAYEVAVIWAHTAAPPYGIIWNTGTKFTQAQWANLPISMKRHFADTE